MRKVELYNLDAIIAVGYRVKLVGRERDQHLEQRIGIARGDRLEVHGEPTDLGGSA